MSPESVALHAVLVTVRQRLEAGEQAIQNRREADVLLRCRAEVPTDIVPTRQPLAAREAM